MGDGSEKLSPEEISGIIIFFTIRLMGIVLLVFAGYGMAKDLMWGPALGFGLALAYY
mgnify:FL=1